LSELSTTKDSKPAFVFLVELLAAIPSVVYEKHMGIFVLIPFFWRPLGLTNLCWLVAFFPVRRRQDRNAARRGFIL